MRRKDREVRDIERVDGIIQAAKILHLGLFDDGYPYVVPLHYGYEWLDGSGKPARAGAPDADPATDDPLAGRKLAFYMHGARSGHKLDLIRHDPHACVELECDVETIPGKIACAYGAAYASVIGRGMASVVEDPDEKVHGLELLMREQTGRDFSISHLMAKTVCVIKVVVDGADLTAKSRPRPEKKE